MALIEELLGGKVGQLCLKSVGLCYEFLFFGSIVGKILGVIVLGFAGKLDQNMLNGEELAVRIGFLGFVLILGLGIVLNGLFGMGHRKRDGLGLVVYKAVHSGLEGSNGTRLSIILEVLLEIVVADDDPA